MMENLTQQLISALIARGCKELPTRSGKYRCFKGQNSTYWVGHRGALRIGDNISSSFGASDDFKRRFIQLAPQSPQQQTAKPITASELDMILDHDI